MVESDFSFRSGRTYLQSATVFDYLLGTLDYVPANIDFEFAKRTENNCYFSTVSPVDIAPLIGRYSDNSQTVFILDSGKPIARMEQYDDLPVLAASTISGREIVVPASLAGFSTVEKIIAGYKYLLKSFPGNNDKKFVFARMKLRRLPAHDITISFKRMVSGNFYQGTILEEDENIGSIIYGEWL